MTKMYVYEKVVSDSAGLRQYVIETLKNFTKRVFNRVCLFFSCLFVHL